MGVPKLHFFVLFSRFNFFDHTWEFKTKQQKRQLYSGQKVRSNKTENTNSRW
jgi:hypothetical protein